MPSTAPLDTAAPSPAAPPHPLELVFPLHPHPRVRSRSSSKRQQRHADRSPSRTSPDPNLSTVRDTAGNITPTIENLLAATNISPSVLDILRSSDLTALMSLPPGTTTVEANPPGIPLTLTAEELMKRKILQLEHDLGAKSAQCNRLQRRVDVLGDLLERGKKSKEKMRKESEETMRMQLERLEKAERDIAEKEKAVMALRKRLGEGNNEIDGRKRKMRVLRDELERLRVYSEERNGDL